VAFHPYIVVEGAIGVGKTTLARILGEVLPAEVLLEVFEENPFLSDFYADRQRYAFQTQLFFLLSRYRQQDKIVASTLPRSILVSDYLFAKDWLFAHLNLAGDELAMYERVHAILGEQIPAPGLVVYLRASIDVLMDRIRYRGRSYETSSLVCTVKRLS
jgi:deoxyguanosine kinase